MPDRVRDEQGNEGEVVGDDDHGNLLIVWDEDRDAGFTDPMHVPSRMVESI